MAQSVALERCAAFMLHCGITGPDLDSQGGRDGRRSAWRRRGRSLVLLSGLFPGLLACSSDDFDPAGWVSGPAEPPKQVTTVGTEDDPGFPSLGSVPPRPRPSPQAERERRAADLQSDLAAARYSEGDRDRPRPGQAEAASPAPAATAALRRSTLAIPRTPTPPGPVPLPPRPLPDQVRATEAAPLAPLAPPGAAPPVPGAATGSDDDGGAAAGRGALVALLYFPALGRELAPADRPLLRDLALLQQQRRGRLRIVGHADAEAPTPQPDARLIADLELSQARAAAVALALVELGVPADRITTAGVGHGQPRFDPGSAAGAAGNRRVEVYLE